MCSDRPRAPEAAFVVDDFFVEEVFLVDADCFFAIGSLVLCDERTPPGPVAIHHEPEAPLC